jgi:DNA polymerase-1
MEGCSFANGESACYINLHNNPQKEGIIDHLHFMFRHKIKSLIMHNAPFDLKVLHKEGIWDVTPKIFCTMTAHHLINENSLHALKFLAEKYLGVTTVSFDKASVCGFDHPMFLQYALNDAKWTWALHKIFNKKIYELGMQRLFFEVEMPFQFCLMDMEINGVLVNEEKLEDLRVKAVATHFDLLKSMYEIAGYGYSIQPDMFTGECEIVSKTKMTDTTYRKIMIKRGLKSPYMTKGGKDGLKKVVSVGAETLTHLAGDEFIDVLTKYKIVDHLLSSFINKMPGHIEDDGRVRSTYWNTGTKTGRLSARDPNMQQNPKEQKLLPFDFKQIFEAPKGKKLLSVDYSGQELRILAIITRDPTLIQAFKDGCDLHLMTANAIFNLGLEGQQLIDETPEHTIAKEKYGNERHIGKNGINFPVVYGTTAYGVAKNVGVTEAVAQEYIDAFFDSYPEVRKAINRTSTFLTENWHVKSLTRRRRRLDPGEKKSHRQAFNFLIQGLAADMIRCACNNMRRVIREHPEWGIKMIMIVHDEIVMEINEEWIEKATPIIRDVMENAMPKLPLTMKVEIGVGDSYSDAK